MIRENVECTHTQTFHSSLYIHSYARLFLPLRRFFNTSYFFRVFLFFVCVFFNSFHSLVVHFRILDLVCWCLFYNRFRLERARVNRLHSSAEVQNWYSIQREGDIPNIACVVAVIILMRYAEIFLCQWCRLTGEQRQTTEIAKMKRWPLWIQSGIIFLSSLAIIWIRTVAIDTIAV